MIGQNLQIHFSLDWAYDAWSVWVSRRGPNGERIPIEITLTERKPIDEAAFMEPSARIRRDDFHAFVSALKDGLAHAGQLESSNAVEAELKATKTHLEDLRKIAFNELGVSK